MRDFSLARSVPFYFIFFTSQQEQPAVRFLLPLTDKLHRHPSPCFFFARLFSGRINYAWRSLPSVAIRGLGAFGCIYSGIVNSRQSVIVIVVALANGS
jgi:hypothetical protein